MKRVPGLALLCLIYSMMGMSYAQEGVSRLKNFVREVKVAQGTFHQTQLSSSGKMIVQTSGKFTFARPGKFIWSTLKPYEQTLQSDGEQLYIWDKDLNQVTVRKLDEAIASSPAAILFGSGTLERYFKLKEGTTRNGVQWVELIPIVADTSFVQITIGFRGNKLAGMELRDTFGNTTALLFTDLDTTYHPSARQFIFHMPKGTEVIQN